MSSDNISEEEWRALFPDEADVAAWLRTKKRIVIRTLLVFITLVARMLIIRFYPEWHLLSEFETQILNRDALLSLVALRGVILVVIGLAYLYSLKVDRHFRNASIVGLVVCTALLWGDVQIFILTEMPDLNLITFGFFGLRLLVLYLLLQNYLDYRR
ncbi:hypothetical protein N9J88_06355 [Porticoccaceae bacterium]|nr:hypothetical protein [Porticoccaceae bacterium]